MYWFYITLLTIATIAFIALGVWELRREHIHPCQPLIDLDAQFRKAIKEIIERDDDAHNQT